MMNGEIPSVPITTLAGVCSLTDLLTELPLPTPLPHTMNNKSLLYHPKVADDARRLLGSHDDVLASQLAKALKQTSSEHIELKDNMANDTIEGEVPELLKAILAKDPSVFKGGIPPPYTDPTGRHSFGGCQPYPPHPQQPSPYQAGQISPCPPGSPARLPPQPGSSPYVGQTAAYPPVGGFAHHSQPSSSATSKFQQQFLNFASSNDGPTVNGGVSGSPLSHGALTPPHGQPLRSSRHAKAATVSSPAQAAAAPTPHVELVRHPGVQPYQSRQLLDGNDTPAGNQFEVRSAAKRKSASKSTEPVVLLEPLDGAALSMSPTVKLTRLEMMPGEYRKSRSDDRHRGSSRSRHDDRRGDRHKRRRPNYIEDDSDENADNHDGSDPEFVEPKTESKRSSIPEAGRSRKRERYKHKRITDDHLSTDELMETATFKKFYSIVDSILESTEDLDIVALNADEEAETTGISGSDGAITKYQLENLCKESAKLKAMGVTNQVPTEKLVKVLSILQLSIKDGSKALPFTHTEEDNDGEALLREITLERVTTAVDAAMVALYIMTSKSMPKEVFIEDVIERLVMMAKTQLQSTIYPEFDPVYRVDPSRGYQGNLKSKRARASSSKRHESSNLYNKLTELVALIAELVDIQELTDTIILQLSTLAVTPFFVENISELQLNALKLVTCVFSRYEKHRQLIMEDILSSLARLPSSKKNLRSYRLNSEENIQMVTALALELIQCVVRLPAPPEEEHPGEKDEPKKKESVVDKEVVIMTSYETSMRTAHNFLAVFLRKCSTKGDEDYRPLFENFVYDLLATVNKPEWPAAELLLSLLGRLLVQQFSNKSSDMSLRIASLDYLGIVAARLRKDAVTSRLNEDTLSELIGQINESDDEEGPPQKKTRRSSATDENASQGEVDKAQGLQKALLEYLEYHIQNDPALVFARQFYIAQWYRDASVEVDKLTKQQQKVGKVCMDAEELAEEMDKTSDALMKAEKRKEALFNHINNAKIRAFSSWKPSPSKLDYENSCLVARYLASTRPFSQSFDIYLTQILKVLCETATAVRTKAMKCLTAVVEADPGILARTDMQKGVHGRFLDQATSVREAAVELVGKFILIRPELTSQYYDMLSERILDTGISVRKRVIKIFRDICLEQPDFDKIPEMCVRMIRRVNDEEGIKKLVNETFQQMWFTPHRETREDAKKRLIQRVVHITDVVSACKDSGYEWLEQLLENLLKKEEDEKDQPVARACVQLVDCLVENVLTLEEQGDDISGGRSTATNRIISCFSTLHLFCKVKASLLVAHTMTIQPYLNIKCNMPGDIQVLHNVTRILELSVPLMEHPSESFLAQLEEDMMKLILKHGMMIVQSCVSCLGAVVNEVTHNYKLVRDCFQKFFGVLSKLLAEHERDPRSPALANSKPTLLRSLFTVGLLCKNFDFDSENFGEKKVCDSSKTQVSIKDRVFDVIMYFMSHEDEDVRHKALTGMGFLCTRHYEFMLDKRLRDVYHDLLLDRDETLQQQSSDQISWQSTKSSSLKMKCQVLRNLQNYLIEEERKMMVADAEWKRTHDKEDLKEMGDIQSGMASTVIQVYLKQVLESFFHVHPQVRLAALGVITLILGQGLVHPVQCVPYLICMGSDCDNQIRIKADTQLQDIEKKYPGFIQMKALHGIKMSYRLQKLLQLKPEEPVRGVRIDQDNMVSLNNFIYSLIRNNRNNRRALLGSLLNMFDESAKLPLDELLYMADNMAFFPYQLQDEPLYIIHQIDILVSVSGSNLLQSFQEIFYPGSTTEEGKKRFDEDEDEDVETMAGRVPDDATGLIQLDKATQACGLLLALKQHLKDMYGFTDGKIHRYSSTDTGKTWDKPVNRRSNVRFKPVKVLELLKKGPVPTTELTTDDRLELVHKYLEFKELMLSIDPDDEEDDDEAAKAAGRGTPSRAPGASTPVQSAPAAGGDAELNTSGEATPEKKPDVSKDNMMAAGAATGTGGGDASSIQRGSSSVRDRSPRSRHSSHHHSSDRKRGRSSGGSSSKHRHHHKSHKHKKKKKKRKRFSDSEEEDEDDDSDSDPDFTG